MRAHIPPCERLDETASFLLVDDREVSAGSRAPEHADTIGRISAATSAEDRAFEEIFDFVRRDAVTCEMLDVVVVPFEVYLIHD